MALLDRLRKLVPESDGAGEAPVDAGPPAARRRLPHPVQLRRERRALLRAREERIRDLGGIVLEMYRRDRFREDLVYERAADLMSLDERLDEIDALLATATATRTAPAARCACGAPVLWRSHFCANCGRPVGETVVVSCGVCGHALPADAKYCAGCGTPAEAVGESAAEDTPSPES
jgi:hypothetical protein